MTTSAGKDAALEPMAFFPHDSNALQDLKIQRLLLRCGWAGYGRWWHVCEIMASASGHRIPFETEEDLAILAGSLWFGKFGAPDVGQDALEECKAFVSELLDIGLLTLDGSGCLKSDRMLENAAYFARHRANGARGGRPSKKRQDAV